MSEQGAESKPPDRSQDLFSVAERERVRTFGGEAPDAETAKLFSILGFLGWNSSAG